MDIPDVELDEGERYSVVMTFSGDDGSGYVTVYGYSDGVMKPGQAYISMTATVGRTLPTRTLILVSL